ncbi:MAG: molybdopterin molybdotransferase MoeA [Planctomycetota bacterium]
MPQDKDKKDSTDIRMKGFKEKKDVVDFLTIIDDKISPSKNFEVVCLNKAAGRVLSSSIISTVKVPNFNRSAMDGYAIRGEETFGAATYSPLDFKVLGLSLPGKPFEGCVTTQTAVRIMTGAPMPEGADSVIPVELAQEENKVLRVIESIPPGKNVGRIGEDVKIGQELLTAGRKLRPQDIGILSSIGISSVSVIKKPIVDIFITGDELLKPGSMPKGYQIVDSNSVMLDALIYRDIQIHPNIIFLEDRRELISDALSKSNADFILVSGGSSVGQEDHAPSLVKELGEILIHGVALRPASPSGMGLINGKYVFLIPGNPVSCLCSYDLFASRAIRTFAGINCELPYKSITLPLASKISSMVGRMDYVRVKISNGFAEPLAISGASMLSTTTIADGFLLVPGECEGYPAGENVKINLYD